MHAYVKDRTICDAVRSIEGILNYTKRYQAEGRSISIYFLLGIQQGHIDSTQTVDTHITGLQNQIKLKIIHVTDAYNRAI